MSANLTNTYDNTPLYFSTHFGQLEATKSLVERDAAINNTSIDSGTPMTLAAYIGKLEIFRYLKEQALFLIIVTPKTLRFTVLLFRVL